MAYTNGETLTRRSTNTKNTNTEGHRHDEYDRAPHLAPSSVLYALEAGKDASRMLRRGPGTQSISADVRPVFCLLDGHLLFCVGLVSMLCPGWLFTEANINININSSGNLTATNTQKYTGRVGAL